ncbi:exported hypothetical protein [Rubrivivax sp. A210]|uniref:hypothetical protein n=1 Tax=Rubrivivax sp. A210 TaxID=2772301 RepID=UPI00191ADC54|nr:hypothetical protein [Rubrivivax sp. A210]CAD5366827.1 exported hypothetical protein [Rubrivivax sp. A210]
MRIRVFLFAFALSSAAIAADQPWPMSSPEHRAIFCGAPGTETSRPYTEALNVALKELVDRGASVQEAVTLLTERARCDQVDVLQRGPK